MRIKLIKTRAAVLASLSYGCVVVAAAGCGDSTEKAPTTVDAGLGGMGDGDGGKPDASPGGGGTYDASFTLVPILAVDTSTPIATPHKIVTLDSRTGKPLTPPVEAMSAAGTGTFTLKGLPKDTVVAFYAVGVGPTDVTSSTYDTVILNHNPLGGDPLFRISSVGTSNLAASSSGYTPKDDRAALSGAIYWSPGGVRKGTVGCAQICIDGGPAPMDFDPRYVAGSGLPTTLAKQSQTVRSGRFFAGNISTGLHTISVSLDECKTTLGPDLSFFVPFSRAEAQSPLKAVLLQLGVDLDLPKNPTPASCPAG